ncbi:MAG TPA: anthranilate phosphoribosyltransferase, partial [Acidimicrobiaceae bacterium]|nr:anthranilate phosphoribosyltransferase [Acidimicrobiaceae bacterium]
IARSIFAGDDRGARRDIVVLNAAAGLVVAGVADDLASAVTAASEAIDDGSARRVLEAVSS